MDKRATNPAPSPDPADTAGSSESAVPHPPTVDFGMAGEGLSGGGNVRAVPALHGQWRFAALVRRAFLAARPDIIAVELPGTLEAKIREGVTRLPWLTLVAHDDFDENLEKIRSILPIVPDDALLEAVRLGMENGVPVRFVDRDALNQKPRALHVPDDYLVERLGIAAYWAKAVADLPDLVPGSDDEAREIQMAAALRACGERRVLFVCGLAHLKGVMHHYAARTPVPAGAVTQREQKLYSLTADSAPYVLGDFPHQAYAYELARQGLAPRDFPQLVPLPLARGGEFQAAQDAWNETRDRLAGRLQTLRPGPEESSAPAHGSASLGQSFPAPAHGSASLGQSFPAPAQGSAPPERPLAAAPEAQPAADAKMDAFESLTELVRTAVRLYQREWNEQPSPSRLTTLLRYARNLGLVNRRLTPAKFHLVLAAQNTVNDDFAYQVLRLCEQYPFVEGQADLPEMKVEGETGEAEGETLVLRLRTPRAQQDGEPGEEIELGDQPEELIGGSWEERWEDGEHHVSHLPQDARLESFFEGIRKRCQRWLSDQQSRSHELGATLMDGLDLRESLRNLPLGKLYVREFLPGVAEVGPVVVIFHKAGEEREYPHEQMWFAEHAGESDLALYSTRPGRQFDGPGISRCLYGGVLSLYPPTGKAQVWGSPRYAGARNRAERLLKAAIDLSRKPIVAYVAAQGPTSEMLSLAASRGIRILYVPLDQLSADSIKRVRTFHVLSDRDIRPLAPLYVN